MYSPITLDHFHHPRGVGELEDPTHTARRENPVCGDVVQITLRVEGGRVAEVRFRAFGCVATIAACSLLAERIRGRPLEEAWALDGPALEKALGGLPATKRHGAQLALDTLWAALGE